MSGAPTNRIPWRPSNRPPSLPLLAPLIYICHLSYTSQQALNSLTRAYGRRTAPEASMDQPVSSPGWPKERYTPFERPFLILGECSGGLRSRSSSLVPKKGQLWTPRRMEMELLGAQPASCNFTEGSQALPPPRHNTKGDTAASGLMGDLVDLQDHRWAWFTNGSSGLTCRNWMWLPSNLKETCPSASMGRSPCTAGSFTWCGRL